MARSTVTGNENAELGMRSAESSVHGGFVMHARGCIKFRIPHSAFRVQQGFSLLELMIAMFIMIILLSVAVPTYQRATQHARETVLKENLWQMRRAIDQFRADKGKLATSLDEIIEAKYLRERPIDPIAENTEWEEVMGEDTNSPDGVEGLVDVKSMAEGTDLDGKAYSEY